MTRGERIREVRKANKLTCEKFGERIGLKKSSVSQLENGVNTPTEQTLKHICKEFNINYLWITEGVGEMNADLDAEAIAIIDSVMTSDNEFAKKVLRAFAKLDEKEWEVIAKLIDEIKKE